MLSDEEKKAIEFVKSELQDEKIARNDYQSLTGLYGNLEIETVLNLIEKQQKEIEELKKNNETQPDCVEPVEKTEEMVNMRWVNHRFISKDKLKEILGIEETDTEKILSLLQTIVDENNRLEDIEDKKVQIEYNNVFNKGVKSVEDKIKAKIEELEKQDRENRMSHNYLVIPVLQSLLEKE